MPLKGVAKSTRQRERRAEQREQRVHEAAAVSISPAASAALAAATRNSTLALAPADLTVDEQLIALLSRVRQCDRSIAAVFLHCGQALLEGLEQLHRSPPSSVPQAPEVDIAAHNAAEDDAAAPALTSTGLVYRACRSARA